MPSRPVPAALLALLLLAGSALPNDPQASDGFPAPARLWTWSDWTGEARSPLFLRDLQPEVEPEAPAAEPEQAPEPEAAEVTEPSAGPTAEQLEATPSAAAPLETPAPDPAPVEAAAPSPWAELDLTLYDRCVAPIPPGIPAARAGSRLEARDGARAELAAALDGPLGSLWRTWLSERLRYSQDDPATWRGLTELVVELELFDLADDLATGLEADPTQLVHQLARHSLAELYGRGFDSRAELEAYIDGLELSPSTLRILAELRAARADARARLVELFQHDRGLALAHLDDGDPRVRMGAAEVLAAELATGAPGVADEVLPALLDRLVVERWPDVAAVLLDTAGDALVGRPSGDLLVERLRVGLADAAAGGAVGAELLVATNLARLPWTGAEASASDSLERGADILAVLFGRVLPAADSGAAADLDVTLGVLRSIERLLPSTGGAEGDRATAARLAGGELNDPLRGLLASPGVETSVRVVAAGILPRVAPASDLALLTDLLADPGAGLTTELRFALLGSMRRFVERGDAGPEVLAGAVDRLEREFQRPESDLRRTALKLLADETLAPYLAGRDLAPFVAGLADADSADQRDSLIALLQRHGTASTLAAVLELDGLSELLAGDPATEAAMARLFGELSADDPGLVLDAAWTLWEVDSEAGRVTRRTRALALVAELPVEVAAGLDGAAHHRISEWASTLRGLGVDLASAMPGGVDFLQRLVDVHVPRSSGPDVTHGTAEKALMTALFLSDVAAARGNGEAERLETRVLENFARAEEAATGHVNPDFRLVVLRARARFHAGSEDPRALPDYAELFAAQREGLLETTDLRDAGRLASATDPVAAWGYGRALVASDSWSQEPPAVRLEDLRLLGEWARATGDAAVLAEALALLVDLPVEPAAEVPGSEGHAWAGLVGDAASLGKLGGIRAELAAAAGALAVTEAPVEPPAEEPPAPEPQPEESTGTGGDETVQPVLEPPAEGGGELGERP